jgi:hypothetical protein
VRQNCDCDLNCAYLFGRRQGISVRTDMTHEKMSSAALFRILFWPRPLSLWVGSSLIHGAAQARKSDYHRQSAVKTDEGVRGLRTRSPPPPGRRG